MVPPHNSEELYAAARGERELWIVPGAEHTMARFVSPEEYTRRVQAFFKQHL
jgi:fermentation-respiration switch protein FrsA (DUF1100 family)